MKYCPLISVYGSLTLNIGNFMNAVCPLKKSTKTDPKDIKSFLQDVLITQNERFPEQIYSKFMQVTAWIVKMNGANFRSVDDSD